MSLVYSCTQKHERDITDLIKYAATRNKSDAQDAPLVHIILKWAKYPPTYAMFLQ